MKKIIISIVVTILALCVGIGSYLLINNPPKSANDGEIIVELIDLDDSVKTKKIKYKKNDNLIDLLSENFNNFKIIDGMVVSIEDFKNADDWSTFISIKIDGEDSMVGINMIEIYDNMVLSFVMTEFIW